MNKIIKSMKSVPLWALLFACVHAMGEQPAVRAVIQLPQERKPAAAFRLADASGKERLLSKFRGKVVLLNFWATECGGCKLELPYFIAFDHLYRSRGLQALGVSEELFYDDKLKGPTEAWDRVKPFVKEHGIEYPIVMADDAVNKTYRVESMPATYLIDKQGRIAATYIGMVDKADIETNLKALLAER
ncbi:MAG: TlpA disulfide reductase family protein [Bryobacteraceae bacterium]